MTKFGFFKTIEGKQVTINMNAILLAEPRTDETTYVVLAPDVKRDLYIPYSEFVGMIRRGV